MSREDFDAIRQHAKETHDRRVADTPRRVQYAIKILEENGIEYTLKNEQTGHIHCRRKKDDKLFQFYAGTGKIQGEEYKRGIHALVDILTERDPEVKP